MNDATDTPIPTTAGIVPHSGPLNSSTPGGPLSTQDSVSSQDVVMTGDNSTDEMSITTNLTRTTRPAFPFPQDQHMQDQLQDDEMSAMTALTANTVLPLTNPPAETSGQPPQDIMGAPPPAAPNPLLLPNLSLTNPPLTWT
jgi:hypothetical protein